MLKIVEYDVSLQPAYLSMGYPVQGEPIEKYVGWTNTSLFKGLGELLIQKQPFLEMELLYKLLCLSATLFLCEIFHSTTYTFYRYTIYVEYNIFYI